MAGSRARLESVDELIQWRTSTSRRLKNRRPTGAAVLSPHLTVEEAYLLCNMSRQFDPQAAVGPWPRPGRRRGRKFHKRLHDSCREVPESQRRRRDRRPLRRRQNRTWMICSPIAETKSVLSGSPAAIKCPGTTTAPPTVRSARLLIVQDWFASPLWHRGDYQFPAPVSRSATAPTSTSTTACNRSAGPSARRPGVWTEGQLYWPLLGTQRPVQCQRGARRNRHRKFPASLRPRVTIPPVGMDLKVNQLAHGGESKRRLQVKDCQFIWHRAKVLELRAHQNRAALGGLMTAAAYLVLLERRMAAWVQDRMAPTASASR